MLAILEDSLADVYEFVDTSTLVAVLGILVNVAATQQGDDVFQWIQTKVLQGRTAIYSPTSPTQSSISELIIMLLVNPPSDSVELLEILLSLLNNLAFEKGLKLTVF